MVAGPLTWRPIGLSTMQPKSSCLPQEQKYTLGRPTDADLLGPAAGITPGSSGVSCMGDVWNPVHPASAFF